MSLIDGDSAPVEQNRLPTVQDAPALETKQPSQMTEGEQFTILKKWFRADRTHSAVWRNEATKWMAFRAGEQWSTEDRQYMNSQQRPAIVFNRVLTILKAVAGMEINGRHEIQFIPRGTEDTKVNELLSAASKWMGDGCDAEDEESQAFENCCTCGLGVTENRMSYEEDSQGAYVEESFDPREFYWDRKSKKKNMTDAKRMWRVRRMAFADARLIFPGKTKLELDAVWARGGAEGEANKTLEERRIRDPNTTETDLGYDDQNEVTIVHAQWIEMENYWKVADEEAGEIHEMTDRQYKVLMKLMKEQGVESQLSAVRLTRKKYKQGFIGGLGMLQAAGPPPVEGRFSWTVITGEYDADKGTWFGLVKTMHDPQMWANKWMSQILHILNSTAKGGILAENDAFDDMRQAEESYAMSDQITWLAKGALSSDKPKVMPKPGQGDPAGYKDLLLLAISSIKDVLGQQDQNQPGVVENMRKQAGMTVLATLFDSLRRFRKQVGRCRLFFIQTYLSDGRLIRVAGPEYVQAVPLVRDKTTGEYDVIIDDAPTSPNQKEANWAIIAPMIAAFRDVLMKDPVLLAEVLSYSPLPSKLVDTVKQMALKAQNDPAAQQQKQETQELMKRAAIAQIAKDEGAAAKSHSGAALDAAKAEATKFDALYNMAMADNMLTDNERAAMEAQLAPLLAAAEAEATSAEARKKNAEAAQASAEATLTRMRAIRERLGVAHDDGAHQNETAESRGRQAESAAKALLDMASAHREREGIRADMKKAERPKAGA